MVISKRKRLGCFQLGWGVFLRRIRKHTNFNKTHKEHVRFFSKLNSQTAIVTHFRFEYFLWTWGNGYVLWLWNESISYEENILVFLAQSLRKRRGHNHRETFGYPTIRKHPKKFFSQQVSMNHVTWVILYESCLILIGATYDTRICQKPIQFVKNRQFRSLNFAMRRFYRHPMVGPSKWRDQMNLTKASTNYYHVKGF